MKHTRDYYETTNKKGKKRIVMTYDVFRALDHSKVCKALGMRPPYS